MEVKIEESWKQALLEEFDKEYFKNLTAFVRDEYQHHEVYPKPKDIFRAFDACPFSDVEVVIIGQDPYHGEGQANGLCFSVNPGVKYPPSLKNIYTEIQHDLGQGEPSGGDLIKWSEQGVLLLNATLTVRKKTPGSHQNKGWEQFTDAVIDRLSSQKENLVFILWGAYAQKKGAVVDTSKHLVISSPHPSPFSVHKGFYGSKPFSKTNNYLLSKGKKAIQWIV